MYNFHFSSLISLALIPIFALLSEGDPSSCGEATGYAPQTPTGIALAWNRKQIAPGCKICEGVATAMGSNATMYQWEITRFGAVEQSVTGGKTWNFGYIEPTDPYTIRVRAVANGQYSGWFSKNFTAPSGCCTQ